MQIGVDIEDSNRFEYRSQSLLDKIFTKSEQEYCLKQAKPSQHFAGKFCAKEATIKALTAYGIKGVYLTDIEIYHDDNNCPCIRVLKDIHKHLHYKLSISHDRTKAIAFVVVRG